MAIDHPAAREELAHFSQALSVIAQEQEGAQERLDDARAALDAARRFDPDNLPVREMQFSLAEQGVRELRLAGEKPYFTRVDFHEEGGSAQQYYIGKNGVTRFRTLEPYIVDWRAPVANLYYSGQVGPMEYESPDGLVRGEMTLKRQFGVEKGQLKTIFDSGIAAQDEFLQSVLGAVTGERLTEIVTTIQAEQNAIIRHPLNRSLIVQGVAGSGKTSIALHRIAFLLYTYQDRLRAESTLILAPNPLFLQYIAPVLPDLGVERVRQTTFSALLQAWLGTGLPPIGAAGSPASARVKGLLSIAQRLDAWLDAYEERILPEEGLSFGPVTLFSGEALRQFILVDEKPFPLERRFKELKKQLSGRVKHAVAQIQQWYKKEAQRRAVRMQDDPQRRERLFAQLDERMQAAEDKSKEYIKETMRAFGDFAPAKLYRQFSGGYAGGGRPRAARRRGGNPRAQGARHRRGRRGAHRADRAAGQRTETPGIPPHRGGRGAGHEPGGIFGVAPHEPRRDVYHCGRYDAGRERGARLVFLGCARARAGRAIRPARIDYQLPQYGGDHFAGATRVGELPIARIHAHRTRAAPWGRAPRGTSGRRRGARASADGTVEAFAQRRCDRQRPKRMPMRSAAVCPAPGGWTWGRASTTPACWWRAPPR